MRGASNCEGLNKIIHSSLNEHKHCANDHENQKRYRHHYFDVLRGIGAHDHQ